MTLTASERAHEINEAAKARRGAGLLVEDAAHWASCGVTTGAQLDRYLLEQDYINVHKEHFGFKPRVPPSRFSDQDLKGAIQAWSAGMEAQEEAAAQQHGPFSIGSPLWPGISKLIEEAGEMQQIAGKLIGASGRDMHYDRQNLRQRLQEELADLAAAIEFVIDVNKLDLDAIQQRRLQKLARFWKWHGATDVHVAAPPSARTTQSVLDAIQAGAELRHLTHEKVIGLDAISLRSSTSLCHVVPRLDGYFSVIHVQAGPDGIQGRHDLKTLDDVWDYIATI